MSRSLTVAWKGKRYAIDLVAIDPTGHELEAGAAAAWRRMVLAADIDGVPLAVRTAFRSREFQASLRSAYEAYRSYLRAVDAWHSMGGAGSGVVEPTRVPYAALAALPGSSEHEVGRAVDIERHLAEPNLTIKIDGWLDAHAAEYGWVRDVASEAWHYGYRGEPLVEAPTLTV